MTAYSFPGVYVNEVPAPITISPGNIPGEAVAAFAANYNVGPTVPTFIQNWQSFQTLFGGFKSGSPSYLPYAVYQYFTNGGTGCYILRVPNSDATQAVLEVANVAGGGTSGTASMTVTAKYPGAWSSNIGISIIPANGSATTLFTLQVYQGGTSAANLVETWPSISLNPASSRYAPGMINSTTSGSSYIKLSGYPSSGSYVSGTSDPYAMTTPVTLGTATGVGQPGIVASTPGADGSTPIDLYGAISGTVSVSTTWPQGSFAQLSGQVLNINLPDSSGVQGGSPAVNYTLINNVLNWAGTIQNVFLVIDGMYGGGFGSSANVAALYTTMTSGGGGSTVIPSPNAAIYGPWLSIVDPAAGTTSATKWVPPGGAVLGIWATSDRQFNAAQTPAGVQAVVNAVALETYFSPTDLGNLESSQINPIKIVPSTGFCVFGGLTTAAGYPVKYININRALMKIAHDLTYITQYAIFQNNDPKLWQSLTTTLTNYLVAEMQDGLLAGNAPTNSFQVICDSSVNTPATIAAGMVNATVAVALAAPAEFVVINLTQMASGSTATISS
jgi:uncharacterized protein